MTLPTIARSYVQAAILRRRCRQVSIGTRCEIPLRAFQVQAERLAIGNYVRFGERVLLQGQSLVFGDHFTCGSDVIIAGHRARFEVGKFSSFATRVSFVLGQGRHRPQSLSNAAFGHVPAFESRQWVQQFDYEAESSVVCRVGHDVWIGLGSVILPNVTIGDGAVIAAGSVVRDDVPPYAIMGGNPAQVVSFRFKQSLIQELLALKWWDWPIDKINRNKAFFTKNVSTSLTLDRGLLAG